MTRCEKELMAKLVIARIMKSNHGMTPQSMWSPTVVNDIIRQIDSQLTASTFTAADLISVAGLVLAGKGKRRTVPQYERELMRAFKAPPP